MFTVVLDETRTECVSTRTFRLRFSAKDRFDFKPGQFVTLHFPDNLRSGRAYSIASSPLERGFIEITLNRVGRFTERLFDLKEGAPLIVKGPFGAWFYEDHVSHAVLISGGTGAAPFRSIARYVAQKGLPNRLTILCSFRSPEEILYQEEWETLIERPNFKVVHSVTRPDLARDRPWRGPVGEVDIRMVAQEAPDLRGAHYYLCGANRRIDSLRAALAERGIPKKCIHTEKWGNY